MTNTTAMSKRLERVEAARAVDNGPVYDLSAWTLEQLETAARMLDGKPDDTRLTDEQLRAIIGTPE